MNFVAEKKEDGSIPESTETSFSSAGTIAHDWADKYLKGDCTREEIPPNVYESIEGYLDFAESMKDARPEAEVFTEQKVNLFYALDHYGTLDFSVADPLLVEILDYKNGFINVEAEDNDQLAIYCRSLMLDLEQDGYDFTDDTLCRMMIYQPNTPSYDGKPKIWEITYEDLKDICIDIEADFHLSQEASVDDLTPSPDACMFCDAKPVCTKRVIEMFDEVPEETNMLVPASRVDDEINLPEIGSLTDAARVAIHKNHKEITKWMKDVCDNTLALIETGTAIDGMKSVDGKQGNRGWGDNELDAEKLLRKLPVALRYKPRRVLSPAQAEKALKKFDKENEDTTVFTKRFINRFDELIYRRPGAPALALDDDKRPARQTAIEVFDEETEDDCF